jgi:hypothetical protein
MPWSHSNTHSRRPFHFHLSFIQECPSYSIIHEVTEHPTQALCWHNSVSKMLDFDNELSLDTVNSSHSSMSNESCSTFSHHSLKITVPTTSHSSPESLPNPKAPLLLRLHQLRQVIRRLLWNARRYVNKFEISMLKTCMCLVR